MRRSRGFRSKSKNKLRKTPRERGMPTITALLRKFELGDKVHISLEPSVHGGMPHHRFNGLTGTIVRRQGEAYLVEVTFKKKKKQLLSLPVHLKLQKGEAS